MSSQSRNQNRNKKGHRGQRNKESPRSEVEGLRSELALKESYIVDLQKKLESVDKREGLHKSEIEFVLGREFEGLDGAVACLVSTYLTTEEALAKMSRLWLKENER